MNGNIRQEVEDHVFITEVLQIMNAQKILCMILEDVIIRLEVKVMNENTKKKFDANVKAINRDLAKIVEGKLPTDELVKMQFEAIRILIDDCEKLVTNHK